MTSLITSILFLITLSTMAFAQQKPGGCPPTGSLGTCAYLCSSDQDCIANQKCCNTACGGTTCLLPVTETVNIVKKGSCPVRPTGRWTCSSTCRSDGDCRGTKKCCKNRCGALACQNAVINDYEDDDYVPRSIFNNNNS